MKDTIPEVVGQNRPPLLIAFKNIALGKDDDPEGWGGISIDELDVGLDIIRLRLREGGTYENFRINHIVNQDEAMIQLQVQ